MLVDVAIHHFGVSICPSVQQSTLIHPAINPSIKSIRHLRVQHTHLKKNESFQIITRGPGHHPNQLRSYVHISPISPHISIQSLAIILVYGFAFRVCICVRMDLYLWPSTDMDTWRACDKTKHTHLIKMSNTVDERCVTLK